MPIDTIKATSTDNAGQAGLLSDYKELNDQTSNDLEGRAKQALAQVKDKFKPHHPLTTAALKKRFEEKMDYQKTLELFTPLRAQLQTIKDSNEAQHHAAEATKSIHYRTSGLFCLAGGGLFALVQPCLGGMLAGVGGANAIVTKARDNRTEYQEAAHDIEELDKEIADMKSALGMR